MQMLPSLAPETLLESGLRALAGGDPATALLAFREAARGHSWEGRHLVATLGYLGHGTSADRLAATHYFDALGARLPLSHRRAMGHGTDARWAAQRPADAGFRATQTNLFVRHALGDDVPCDVGRALHYCHLAAAAGDVRAQAVLGRAYRQGVGVRPDPRRADHWRELAAAGRAALRRAPRPPDPPRAPGVRELPDHMADFARRHGGSVWCLGELPQAATAPATVDVGVQPGFPLLQGPGVHDARWLKAIDERWSLGG